MNMHPTNKAMKKKIKTQKNTVPEREKKEGSISTEFTKSRKNLSIVINAFNIVCV